MVKHVILWKLKEMSAEEKAAVVSGIRTNLEALVGVVPRLVSLKIETLPLASSNADVMLDSVLEDEAALKGYAVHPAHVAAANTYVRPFTAERFCFDYTVR